MNYLFGWETAETVGDAQTEMHSNIEAANGVISELIKRQESLTVELAKANDDLAKAQDEIKRLKYANRLQMSRCRTSMVSLRGALSTLESAVSLGLPPEEEEDVDIHRTPLVSPQFIESASILSDDKTGNEKGLQSRSSAMTYSDRQNYDAESSEQ